MITRVGLIFLWLMSWSQILGTSRAESNYSLEQYLCSVFLTDIAKPDDPQKLMRSLMMISWATGYAAAHQQEKLKADARSFQVIAAVVGDACRQFPDGLAISVFAEAIRKATKK